MSQTEFVTALLDPTAPTPKGLITPEGEVAERRFAIYRNNVAVSLTEALEAGFPALQTLIGPTRFKALAGIYLRTYPPSDPRLMYFGDKMAELLPTIEPLSPYPYLADVAQLEWAIRRSYHAEDSMAFDPATLGALSPDELSALVLNFAPATRLVTSRYPLHAIWASTQQGGTPPKTSDPQWVLITRPDYDPQPHPVDPETGAAILQLIEGRPLGVALDALGAPEALLGLLLSSGALAT